ncbi:MAG: DUF2090 domain-containing protein, partial [OCS116 cluster bacterium]|nr:DUF2090 domain-containing protein [OCS116 cluster bacterium]
WMARPVEWPASRPLSLEPELGVDFGGLSEWPREHVVKVLCFCHPDNGAEMQAEQEATLLRLASAVRRNRLELLLEVIPSKVAKTDDETTAKLIKRFYEIGIYPDWWKLEPMKSAAAWENTCKAVAEHDPHCRGIVVLGLDAPQAELAASFDLAAKQPLVKGFAVGRTIFGIVAKKWFAGDVNDAEAVKQMTENYRSLCMLWDEARGVQK